MNNNMNDDLFFTLCSDSDFERTWFKNAVYETTDINKTDEYYSPVTDMIKEILDTYKKDGKVIRCTLKYYEIPSHYNKTLSNDILKHIDKMLHEYIYQAFKSDTKHLIIVLTLCPKLTSNTGELSARWFFDDSELQKTMYIDCSLSETTIIMHDLSTY